MIATVARDLHETFAWVVILANAAAGAWALAAHWLASLRRRALWWVVAAAESTLFLQAALGVGLLAAEDLEAPQFHVFYGFVAIIAVGILYSYRSSSPWVRANQYLVYGLGGLFLMGLALRAQFLLPGG